MLQLTKSFIACRACPRDFGNGDGLLCSGTPGWEHDWVPPRGWAGDPQAGHRPILTVSLNPGHPLDEEFVRYAAAGVRPTSGPAEVTDAAASSLLEFCNEFYDSEERSKDHVYAKKVVGYVRAAAWLVRRADPLLRFDPARVRWQEVAWITDSFKCSTVRDSGPRIPFAHMQRCVERHLRAELAAVTPRIVLALGGAASRVLTASGIEHVAMRHPSNGCPRLDDPRHDGPLGEVAARLGLSAAIAGSGEFREFRAAVQARLFGTAAPPPLPAT